MIRPGGGMRAPRSHCVFVAIDSHSDCWGTLVVGGDNRIAVSRSRMVALFLVAALVAVVAVVVSIALAADHDEDDDKGLQRPQQ